MSIDNIVIYLISYIYTAIMFQYLAQKTKTPNRWMAWIPFAQLYLFFQIAKKPASWFWLSISAFALTVISLVLLRIFGSSSPVTIFFVILGFVGEAGLVGVSIASVVALYSIIKILGKPEWTIILIFIPIVNLFFIAYLAFSQPAGVSNPEIDDKAPHHRLWGN
jgi:hypothetical protein